MSHKPSDPRITVNPRRVTAVIEPVLRRNFCAPESADAQPLQEAIGANALAALEVDLVGGHPDCSIVIMESR